jgi:3-oxoacyl-[acyl-carrier-protein] synthase-3
VDTLPRTVNWQDRNTCVLFGDGAGAVLLRAPEGPAGVLATLLGSDGSGKDLLIIPAGGSLYPASRETLEQGKHYLQMNGREVSALRRASYPMRWARWSRKRG